MSPSPPLGGARPSPARCTAGMRRASDGHLDTTGSADERAASQASEPPPAALAKDGWSDPPRGRLSGVEIIKSRTARGRGRWGHNTYDVELISSTQLWLDSAGSHGESLSSYELACSPPVGSRYFATVADRDAFIAASFSEMVVHPVEPPEFWQEEPSLSAVLGVPLVDIEFVEDYFQLFWPDDYLLVYSDVALLDPGHRWGVADPDFAENLRELVGRRLVAVDELLDRGLVLAFEGSVELEISLTRAAPGCSEAAEHSSKDQWTRGSLWPVGAPPFDR